MTLIKALAAISAQLLVMTRSFLAAELARPLGALAGLVGASWYIALMAPLWRAGAICGHVDVLLGHCPACFAALALAGGGVFAAVAPPVRLAHDPRTGRR